MECVRALNQPEPPPSPVLSSSAEVPQRPHGDSGQATPMAPPGLTCQCGNLSTQVGGT